MVELGGPGTIVGTVSTSHATLDSFTLVNAAGRIDSTLSLVMLDLLPKQVTMRTDFLRRGQEPPTVSFW